MVFDGKIGDKTATLATNATLIRREIPEMEADMNHIVPANTEIARPNEIAAATLEMLSNAPESSVKLIRTESATTEETIRKRKRKRRNRRRPPQLGLVRK